MFQETEKTQQIGLTKFRINNSGTVLSWAATPGGGTTYLHMSLDDFYAWLTSRRKS